MNRTGLGVAHLVICLLLAFLLALPVRADDVVQPLDVQWSASVQAVELPTVDLTADVLYRILAAEMAAQRGLYELASATLLDVARDTRDPRLAQRALQVAVVGRDMSRAYAAARQWSQLAPHDQEAARATLALAAASGQTDGLASVLAQGIAQAEDKEIAIAQAFDVVSRLRDKRAALRVLEEVLLPAQQRSSAAHIALSDAAWAARDVNLALIYAEQARQLAPDAEDVAQRILEYGMAVHPDVALAQTRSFLQTHPHARQLHLMLVNHLSARGAVDEALAHLQAMREVAPEDFDLIFLQAQVHARAQQYGQARALLDAYLAVQTQRQQTMMPDTAEDVMGKVADARLLLVDIAEQQGALDEAIAQLDLVDPPYLAFQVGLRRARLEGRQGRVDAARATLAALTPQDSRQREMLAVTLASIYQHSGRTDHAVSVLEDALRQDPDSVQLQYDVAMLYERQGRVELFETYLKRILEVEPDHVHANNALGYTLVDQNRRLDEARVLLERAETLEPDNPYILDSVGWYHYRRGNLERALAYLRRAYAAMPAADVAAHLGEVLWIMQQPAEARTVWQEGLRVESGNETLRKTLQSLGVTLP